jgi:type IV pilus assembly protein PilF
MSAPRVHALTAALLLAGVLGGCVSTAPPARKVNPDDAAAYNVQLGIAYMQEGELQLAKDKLERAAKENPSDPNVHSALGLLYERLGDTHEADEQFHAALRLAPQNPEIANNYAVYLCRTNRVDEGVKRLLAVAHDPLYRTPEAAYTNAGVCQRTAHKDDEAQRNFERALAIRPSFSEAAFQLADLQMQRGQLREARAGIDSFLATNGPTPDLLLLGVRICRVQKDRVGEERYAQRLRVDFPDSDQARALAQSAPNPG